MPLLVHPLPFRSPDYILKTCSGNVKKTLTQYRDLTLQTRGRKPNPGKPLLRFTPRISHGSCAYGYVGQFGHFVQAYTLRRVLGLGEEIAIQHRGAKPGGLGPGALEQESGSRTAQRAGRRAKSALQLASGEHPFRLTLSVWALRSEHKPGP